MSAGWMERFWSRWAIPKRRCEPGASEYPQKWGRWTGAFSPPKVFHQSAQRPLLRRRALPSGWTSTPCARRPLRGWCGTWREIPVGCPATCRTRWRARDAVRQRQGRRGRCLRGWHSSPRAAVEFGNVQRAETAAPIERGVVVVADVIVNPHHAEAFAGVELQRFEIIRLPVRVERADDGLGGVTVGVHHRLLVLSILEPAP